MGKLLHLITNVDPVAMLGDCQICGRTRVRLRLGKYYRCRTLDNQLQKRYRKNNPEQAANASKKSAATWRSKNAEKSKARSRQFRKENPGACVAHVRARKLAKLQRIPKWADIKAIQRFYEACPPGHQVDHIIPLRGKAVSGLHVLNNLQYLTVQENRKKRNTYNPTAKGKTAMPETLCSTPLSPRYQHIGLRFGQRIRSLRRGRNMTQVDMAVDFGIDRSFISDLENGRKAPSLHTIEVIAIGFKVSIPELFTDL